MLSPHSSGMSPPIVEPIKIHIQMYARMRQRNTAGAPAGSSSVMAGDQDCRGEA
jgi:hypothetical protein